MHAKGRIALWVLVVFVIGVLPAVAQEGGGWGRFVSYVANAPAVNVFVNGEMASTTPVGWGHDTGFASYPAGVYEVSVQPATEGEMLDIAPIEVTVEEGHHVTVVLTGPLDEMRLEAFDETVLCPFDTQPGSVCTIYVHNIAGAPGLTWIENGQVTVENAAPGEVTAALFPAANWDTSVGVSADDPETVIFPFDTEEDGQGGFWEPNTVYLFGLMGTWPGEDNGIHLTQWYSPLYAADFLAGFSGLGITAPEGAFSFDTFLAAVEAAGLTDLLSGSEAHTLFVPTDGLLATLTDFDLDALMADPDALRAFVLNHIVEGVPTLEQLLSEGTTLTTLADGELKVSDEVPGDGLFNLNGDILVADWFYPVANDQIFVLVNNVLMPPTE